MSWTTNKYSIKRTNCAPKKKLTVVVRRITQVITEKEFGDDLAGKTYPASKVTRTKGNNALLASHCSH